MQPQYNNITFRRKRHKNMNKVYSELLHSQNNHTANENLHAATGFNSVRNKNEEKVRVKKHKKKTSDYSVDPSTEEQNDYAGYEKNTSLVTDSSSSLYNVTPYIQIVNNKEERIPTNSLEPEECGDKTLNNKKWKSVHIKEYTQFMKAINSNINSVNNMQTCDIEGQNAKIKKKKDKLCDLQKPVTLKAIYCENQAIKNFQVDNDCSSPKKKFKKIGISDLEMGSFKIDSPKQKLYEIDSDSIDMQNKLKFKKGNRKRFNENSLHDTVNMKIYTKSKHRKDLKNNGELTSTYFNEDNGCTEPETKSNYLIISPEISNFCHENQNGSTVNIIEGKQNKSCNRSTENCIKNKDKALLYETSSKNSCFEEESVSKQDVLHKKERQICLNESENIVKSDSNSFSSHLFRKAKNKKKHKIKLENNFFLQNMEEFESASSDFLNTKNKKKKKNKSRLEERKILQESKNHVSCPDILFIKNMKKKKRNKSQDCDQDSTEGFTDLCTDNIKKKQKYKNELDKIKDKLLTQALEKFKSKCVEHGDKPVHVNKKANEVLGSNESVFDSGQKKFLKKQKKQLHTTSRIFKNENEDLENWRTVLLSSALKSVRYKKSESNDIQIDFKKSNIKKAVKEINQSSCDKQRKHKKEERGKVKGKDMYESAHNLNKKLVKLNNAQYNENEIRKALISAALKRIEQNEQKQKNQVPLLGYSEHEVKPKHKNKNKIKNRKSCGEKQNL